MHKIFRSSAGLDFPGFAIYPELSTYAYTLLLCPICIWAINCLWYVVSLVGFVFVPVVFHTRYTANSAGLLITPFIGRDQRHYVIGYCVVCSVLFYCPGAGVTHMNLNSPTLFSNKLVTIAGWPCVLIQSPTPMACLQRHAAMGGTAPCAVQLCQSSTCTSPEQL